MSGSPKHNRRFDFTGYKRPSLMRRIRKRMQTGGVERVSAYQDYLEVHPEEFAPLFNTILINVTGFFRDPAAWDYLAARVIPHILEGKKPDEPIRVWSAGCASGEEAYSLAMQFADASGADAFIEGAGRARPGARGAALQAGGLLPPPGAALPHRSGLRGAQACPRGQRAQAAPERQRPVLATCTSPRCRMPRANRSA